MTVNLSEAAFEKAIEGTLLNNGYTKGDPTKFNAELALMPDDYLQFVKATQAEKLMNAWRIPMAKKRISG